MNTPTVRPPYWAICREEQNFAAILYAALCQEDKARIFMNLCGVHESVAREDVEIYFEYAYLRDFWKTLKTDKERKDFINEKLGIDAIKRILLNSETSEDLLKIDKTLCSDKGTSSSQIRMPGQWSLTKLMELRASKKITPEEYENLCRFKWVFNIKPDIVIHLGGKKALCIETKHESGEGQYSDKATPPFRCGQFKLQEYLMTHVLGFEETKFLCIASADMNESGWINLTWSEVFGNLGMLGEGRAKDYLPFTFHLIDNVSKFNERKT